MTMTEVALMVSWYSNERRRPFGAGRPRSQAADDSIQDAALALLAERGYDGTTIGAVAARAGVGTKTIYRRYVNREEMITDAIEQGLAIKELPNTGDVLADLRRMLDHIVASTNGPMATQILAAALVVERRHPEVLMALRRVGVWPRRKLLRGLLERGVRKGVVRDDIDLDAVVDLAWGVAFARQAAGVRGRGDLVEQAVDVLMRGINGPQSVSEVEMDYDVGE